MNQRIDLVPVDAGVNRCARDAAYEQISWPINLANTQVSYSSQGHVLLIGDSEALYSAITDHPALHSSLASLTLICTDMPDDALLILAETSSSTLPIHIQPLLSSQRNRLKLEGHLGDFRAWLSGGSLTKESSINLAKALVSRDTFDLVVDLASPPCLELELLPPGYFHLPEANGERNDVLASLPDWVGDFDKPRYFQIASDACAHSTRGFTGCTRCLDVCPADAISSHKGRIDSRIDIDPFRCHGVGSCSSACPTGAIEFRQPLSHLQQDTLVAWLSAYHDAGGSHAIMRFVQAEPSATAADLPGHVIEVPLEDLGTAGSDQWLTALAAGACEVHIQAYSDMPVRLQQHLHDQLAQARGILEAIGLSPERLVWRGADDAPPKADLPRFNALPTRLIKGELQGSSGTSHDAPSKRARLNCVLEHLAAHGHLNGERHSLPSNSPFGAITVDSEGCTLCMSCVASCPTPALNADQDAPRLSFREADCVQCGLCEQSCPEHVIHLVPGFLAAPERTQYQLLHEDQPFACIHCGKPFANTGTITAIQKKLAEHPYFSGAQAKRLEMCQDCRVKDIWEELAHHPDSPVRL
uniref:4Fe-4S binding protein n=1 Tax=Halomonas sp. TaxID=1486246 RepID=UPI00262819A2|nr:4Fe-4S binding protein [Halomonas sp.]